MKIELSELFNLANKQEYVFYNEIQCKDGGCFTRGVNWIHGDFNPDNEEERLEYKKVKRLYGFMLTIDSVSGDFTGNRVCNFIICKNSDYYLFSTSNFNKNWTEVKGHSITFNEMKEEKNRFYLNNFYLFSTKKEAEEALLKRRDELSKDKNELRRQHLESEFNYLKEKMNKIESELKNLKEEFEKIFPGDKK